MLSKVPDFQSFLNESSTHNKTFDFENINGSLKLYLKFQPTEGYDTLKPVSNPEAELKLWLENKDSAIFYFYQGNDFEKDRDEVYKRLKRLIKEFDDELKKILKNSNFIK